MDEKKDKPAKDGPFPMSPGAARRVAAAALVSGEGCVGKGVERGCLIVKVLRAGAPIVYQLRFAGPNAAVGMRIRFQGRVHDGPTPCQQGVPVDVTSWTPIGECAPSEMG